MRSFLRGVLVLVVTLGVLGGVTVAIRSASAAQPPEPPVVAVPVNQHLILAHYNGTTQILEEVLPVGNRASSGRMEYITPRLLEVVSDTLYYRGYLQFDTSTIPSQSTVVEADLVLFVDHFEYQDVVPPGEAVACGVYPVTEAWTGAAGPGWNWDDNPRIITTTTMHTTFPFDQRGVYTVAVTSLVQEWVNGAANHGVMVGAYPDPDDVGLLTAIIAGPTVISETLRPRLDVTYLTPTPSPTPSPEPTATPNPTATPDPTSPPQPTQPPPPPPPTAPSQPSVASSPTPSVVPILLPETGEFSWAPSMLLLSSLGLVSIGFVLLMRRHR